MFQSTAMVLKENEDHEDPVYALVDDGLAAHQRVVDARFRACGFDASAYRSEYGEETRIETVSKYRKQLDALLNLPKVEQKTDAWYAMRQSMITASDLAQALGKGKFGSVKQFYEKKCDDASTSNVFNEKNPFFVWGHMFEPVAIDIYSRKYGVTIHEFGLIQDPRFDFFGASPDGISDAGVLLEIKCPLKRQITGDVPMQYYYQIQGQLSATELYECDYFEANFESCCSLQELLDVRQNFEHFGVIVETTFNAPGTVLPYHYMTDEPDPESITTWIESFDPAQVRAVKYWVLRKYYVRRIVRDDALVEEAVSVRLRKVWQHIKRFKQDRAAFVREVKGKIQIDTEPLEPKAASSSSPDAPMGWAFIDEQ